jgi:hypothetical protein
MHQWRMPHESSTCIHLIGPDNNVLVMIMSETVTTIEYKRDADRDVVHAGGDGEEGW